MIRSTLTILVIFIGSFVSGQEAQKWSFTHFGIEEGLSNLSISVLGQDSTGYIWLSDPLARFDGKNFKTYLKDANDESSGYIKARSMADDGQGNLLFADYSGIYYFDKERQYVLPIPSKVSELSATKIFYSEPNIFWGINSSGLIKINLPSFDISTYELNYNFVGCCYYSGIKNGADEIWVVVEGNKIGRMNLNDLSVDTFVVNGLQDASSIEFVHKNPDNLSVMSKEGLWTFDDQIGIFERIFNTKSFDLKFKKQISENISKVYLSENRVWFIDSKNHIIIMYNLLNKKTYSIYYDENFDFYGQGRYGEAAIESSKGALLIGSVNHGLIEIDILNDTIYTYSKINENGISSNYVIPEKKIGQNTFFLRGVGQGLTRAETSNTKFEKIVRPNFKNPVVDPTNTRSFAEWNDKIIVGSTNTIGLFDHKKTKSFSDLTLPEDTTLSNFPKGLRSIIKDDYDNLLLLYWYTGPDPSIQYFDYQNNRIISLDEYFPNSDFQNSRTLFLDSKNNFWIPNQDEIYKVPASLLKSNKIASSFDQIEKYNIGALSTNRSVSLETLTIEEDSNNQIWAGTSLGLFCINQENKQIEYYKNKRGDKTSLSHDIIYSLEFTESNDLWIGTNGGGLNKFDFETKKFQRIGLSHGLPDNTIYTLIEDGENRLWMGTNKGLCRYNPKTGESHGYTTEDGLQDYEFNRGASFKTEEGLLYFGGIYGFNVFDPSQLNSKSTSSNLVVSSFSVNNVEKSFEVNKIKLTHNENFLKFEFNLLDYYKSEKIQYAYMLEGLEDDWNYSRNRNIASYPGLNPGSYTFKVKAANSEGDWTKNIISKPIYISTPWWKTWWFFLVSLCLFLGAIYAYYKNRQNQKEKIIDLRNRISQDLHDEIGSTLSSISLFGTVANKLVDNDQEGTKKMLSRINDSTTQVMESMNDIVWAINSENDKVGNLQKRMRAFVSELEEASDINISLDVDKSLKDTFINMVQRRNVYLIFKEATNNAFKYSDASEINITLNQSKNLFILMVKDNGIGFDKDDVSLKASLSGNGLKNMARRADELEGTLEIISSKHQGTEIRFTWNPKIEPTLNKKQ